MTDKLKQTIEEEVAKLPKEWKEAVESSDWIKKTEDIGKSFGLDEDKINDLELETLIALVGATDQDFFATNIENQVETTTNEADQLAKKISADIIIPVILKMTESIKKNIAGKKTTWKQDVDFILSGGDYSVFMEEREGTNRDTDRKMTIPSFSIDKEHFKNGI